MDFFEAMEKRHSYRGEFLPDPVPRQDILRILDAGIRAPSGLNTQTTSFIAVTDPRLRAQLHGVLQKPGTAMAPLIIVVLTQNVMTAAGFSFEVEDYGAAVENMLLAVTALDYATVWIDGFTRQQGRDEQIARLLGVEDDRRVRCVLPVSRPAQQGKQAAKKPFKERAVIL